LSFELNLSYFILSDIPRHGAEEEKEEETEDSEPDSEPSEEEDDDPEEMSGPSSETDESSSMSEGNDEDSANVDHLIPLKRESSRKLKTGQSAAEIGIRTESPMRKDSKEWTTGSGGYSSGTELSLLNRVSSAKTSLISPILFHPG